MTTKASIKVVTPAERERRPELVADELPSDDPTRAKASDSATIFGKWIREWRQERRSGNQKKGG